MEYTKEQLVIDISNEDIESLKENVVSKKNKEFVIESFEHDPYIGRELLSAYNSPHLMVETAIKYSASKHPNKDAILKNVRYCICLLGKKKRGAMSIFSRTNWQKVLKYGPISLKDIYGPFYDRIPKVSSDVNPKMMQEIIDNVLEWKSIFINNFKYMKSKGVINLILSNLEDDELLSFPIEHSGKKAKIVLFHMMARLPKDSFGKIVPMYYIDGLVEIDDFIEHITHKKEVVEHILRTEVLDDPKFLSYIRNGMISFGEDDFMEIMGYIARTMPRNEIARLFPEDKRVISWMMVMEGPSFIFEEHLDKGVVKELMANKTAETLAGLMMDMESLDKCFWILKAVEEHRGQEFAKETILAYPLDSLLKRLVEEGKGFVNLERLAKEGPYAIKHHIFWILIEEKEEEVVESIVRQKLDLPQYLQETLAIKSQNSRITDDLLVLAPSFMASFFEESRFKELVDRTDEVDGNKLMRRYELNHRFIMWIMRLLVAKGISNVEFGSFTECNGGHHFLMPAFKTETDYTLSRLLFTSRKYSDAATLLKDGIKKPIETLVKASRKSHIQCVRRMAKNLAKILTPTKEGLLLMREFDALNTNIAKFIPVEPVVALYEEDPDYFFRLIDEMSREKVSKACRMVPYSDRLGAFCWDKEYPETADLAIMYLKRNRNSIAIKHKKFARMVRSREDIAALKDVAIGAPLSSCGNNVQLAKFLIEYHVTEKNLSRLTEHMDDLSPKITEILMEYIKLAIPFAPKGEDECQLCCSRAPMYGCPARTSNCKFACCGCALKWLRNNEKCPNCKQSFDFTYSFV